MQIYPHRCWHITITIITHINFKEISNSILYYKFHTEKTFITNFSNKSFYFFKFYLWIFFIIIKNSKRGRTTVYRIFPNFTNYTWYNEVFTMIVGQSYYIQFIIFLNKNLNNKVFITCSIRF